MATTAMDYETANGDRYDDDGPRYERDQRSASPRASRDDGIDTSRRRSVSPGHGQDHRLANILQADFLGLHRILTSLADSAPKDDNGKDEDGSINPGSNLFVTGIHPRLSEAEVTRLFEKYGEVEKCQIMKDPHTKESRGFGFVKMVTSDQADAAKDGLQNEEIEGRTLSIEKARRARPRTPTPGKYFGPPKREGGRPRFDERRRGGGYGGGYGGGHHYGGGGGYAGRDDPYRYRGGGGGGYDRPRNDDRGGERGYREDRGYDRNYRDDRGGYSAGAGAGGREDRGHDRGYERRERGGDESYGRVDRYGGGREERDRYGPRGGDDRRGPSYDRDRYERPERDGARAPREPAASGYGESSARTEARDPYASAP
ncbi:RNA-binding domain-containing protein [Poronia punctata]|nr:RNA-binding domain-containing protein [Poronia punctata]